MLLDIENLGFARKQLIRNKPQQLDAIVTPSGAGIFDYYLVLETLHEYLNCVCASWGYGMWVVNTRSTW